MTVSEFNVSLFSYLELTRPCVLCVAGSFVCTGPAQPDLLFSFLYKYCILEE